MRNGCNMTPRLGAQNSSRPVGGEFGDDFWMAALTDKVEVAHQAEASPPERDSDTLSQASTQGWGSTPTSQHLSPVTDDGTPRNNLSLLFLMSLGPCSLSFQNHTESVIRRHIRT